MATDKPELFFGLTSAVGTPLDLATDVLDECLASRGYDCDRQKLSTLPNLILSEEEPALGSLSEYERVRALMKRGNEARRHSGENGILATLAVGLVNADRAQRDSAEALDSAAAPLRGRATVFRQLKHPAEAYVFRRVYDEGFHLIGVHCPRRTRIDQLVVSKGLKQEQADHLADIDEFEEEEYGQRVRDTFHLSDVFIRSFADATDKTELRRQLSRFHDLLFGDGIHTPSRDEYGMFTAYAAGLRSAQLARQVGAAILAEDGEVLSIGCNEVPKGGGGQYWEGDDLDGRDHAEVKGDSSDFMKRKVLSEILDVVLPDWRGHSEHEREANLTTWQNKLRGKRVMNLTEFGRAVHAEMEALMGAVRVGASVRGATLYVTTFPCHNCAKHIVSAGIKRVVFIEPYPKSLALDLHPDSIVMDEPGGFRETDKRVRFDAFVGIAPRRYIDFFAMTTRDGRSIRRKDETGKVQIAAPGLRLRSPEHSFQELESLEAKHAEELTTKGERANETGNAGGAADRA